MRELCDRHDVLLIADEVATGFGRTGRMFACEHEDVAPDLLCLAKGITGGYLPLAATLASERIYEGFLGEFEEFRTFFHGHTYTGNPLACAAALATLDVFEEERTLDALAARIDLLGELLEPVAAHPAVREVRRVGFMVGIELEEFPLAARMGHRVTLEARRRGAIIRPLGDVVVLMPPLSISEADLSRLVGITAAAIDAATWSAELRAAASSPRRPSVDPGAGKGVLRRRPDFGTQGRSSQDARQRAGEPPSPALRQPRTARGRRTGALALVGLEVPLARSADRAEPVVRDVREGGAGRDAAVGVALLGVVDEPAGGADPLLGLRHRRDSLAAARR